MHSGPDYKRTNFHVRHISMNRRIERLSEAWYCHRIWTRSEWMEWLLDFAIGR